MSRRQGKRDRRDAAAAAGAAVGDDTAAAGAAAVGDYDAAAVAAGDAAGFAVAEWLLVNAGLTDAVARAAYYTGWWARGYWGLPFQDFVAAGHLAASGPPPGLGAPAVRPPPVFVRPS